ncbi:MAG: hypothetical protein Q9166_002440 [cf. Caloplaca sp. 2 TL-2023]
MTRKTKFPKQQKRLELTDSDGWTHITKGLRNVHLSKPPPFTNPLQPAEIPRGQILADLQESYSRYCSQWLASPCCNQIRKLFEEETSLALRLRERKVDRCVVLGLGSLSNGRRSSWWELVFLERFLSLLSSSSSSSSSSFSSDAHPTNPEAETEKAALSEPVKEEASPKGDAIKVYIQDPIFNTLDHQFLSSLGYTILIHPSAFAEVTSSTFLFAPHLEIEIYAQALEGAGQPVLCLGTDLQECVDRLSASKGSKEDEEERRAQNRIFQGYLDATVSKRLPEFERDNWMYFTSVYWMKPSEEQKS